VEERVHVARSAAGFRRQMAERDSVISSVVGTSMLPTLRPGEIVRFAPCNSVAPGMIIAFELDEAVVVHRVVTVEPDVVTCRGDNRLVRDRPVGRDAVLGVLVEVLGRLKVPDGRLDVGRVRRRLVFQHITQRWWRALSEIHLLVSQAGVGGPTQWARPIPVGWDQEAEKAAPVRILGPDGLPRLGDEEQTKARGAVVIPAGMYSHLDLENRAALLRSLGEEEVHVWTYAIPPQWHFIRCTGWLRARLAVRGRSAGSPGDMCGSGSSWRRCFAVHAFTVVQLRQELEAAGARDVTCSVITNDDGRWYLRAVATLPGSEPRTG
jgi:hypothetical protein